MNYRNLILDLTRYNTAEKLGLPVAAYWLEVAVEQVCDRWFNDTRPDGYHFESAMDAAEAADAGLLAYLVNAKFVELQQTAEVAHDNWI